ncbi:hypothetical protein D3C79_873740 [compost metagenome]
MGLTEREGEHGTGGGAPYPGQGHHLFKSLRKQAAVQITDLLRRLVQVAGTGVVTEPGPVVQHLVDGGVGQRQHIGEAGHEALIVGDDGGDLGLLQHDLGDPDPVGGLVLLPGQGLAAVDLVPVQDPGGESAVI